MINFYSFQGTVTMISNFNTGQNGGTAGCYKFISLINDSGDVVNFVVSPSTYFVDHAIVAVGDRVTGYYNGNAPAILIYPPQYQALVMVKEDVNRSVKVDYFNSQLISSDGQLQVTISPYTPIRLTNGQPFIGNPANHDLIVIYGPATMSIPAQTTPYQIIVLCIQT